MSDRQPLSPEDEYDAEWRAYKLDKAMTMVLYEYSVEWTPIDANWMTVYTPGCPLEERSELRAAAKFYMDPSKYGIDGGRISKLYIQEVDHSLLETLLGQPAAKRRTVFAYDRGPDFNHLDEHPAAQTLHNLLLQELN